jgi:hypothetical protein
MTATAYTYQLELDYFTARVYLAGCLYEDPNDQKYHYTQKRILGALINSHQRDQKFASWYEQFKYKAELENKCDEIIGWMRTIANCIVTYQSRDHIRIYASEHKIDEISLNIKRTFGPL